MVSATMTTVMGLASPAETAAWPITSTPTMDNAPPTICGIRMVASRSTSIEISMISTSRTAGKGTPALPPEMATAKFVGISSGLNEMTET
ncbi:hypothetical protein D3C71_1526660 [compost metagenome]